MSLSLGTRVAVKGDPGTVRFIGRTQFSTGQWVGIELDVPNGKNDGSVQGEVYFECRNETAGKHYGLFVRPGLVKIIDVVPNTSHAVRRHISSVPSPDLRPALDGKFNTLSPQLDNDGFGAPITVSKRQNRLLRQPSTPVLQPAFEQPRILKGDSSSALSNQIERLKSKLKVMERKRLEDRDRTTSDSRKIAKLENIVKRLQVKLQPMHEEIQSLRQRINELEMANTSFTNQISDQDALEMATLDREMAEEKSETLQIELNALRQKFEDLELECEILKEENALYASSQTGGEGDQATIIRLEKRNEKLEMALIKLREVYNSQELSHQKMASEYQEEVSELKSAVASLQQTKDKLEDADVIILDLRQQLDNALGAEDMIESLSEKNLEYSEKIAKLEATIEELETLKELNDELEANHVFREKELLEEIESLHAESRLSIDSFAQIEERNGYYESTILKFRDLVNSLNAQLEDQKSSTENVRTINEAKEFANMDLNLSTSGFIRTLELELQKFESQQVIQQLEIVKCYLLEDYSTEAPAIDFFLQLKRLALQSMLTRKYMREMLGENLTLNGKICGLLIDIEYFCLALVETMKQASSEEFVKYGELESLSGPMAELLNSAIEQIKSKELRESEFLKIANSHWMKLRRLADDIPATADAHIVLSEIYDLCELASAFLHYIESTEIGSILVPDLEPVARTKVISKNLMAELSEHTAHTLNPGDVQTLRAVRETAKSISNYLISISSKIDEESDDFETCAIHINSLQPRPFAEQLFDIKKVKTSTLVKIEMRDEPWTVHAKRMREVKDREEHKAEMIEKLEDQEKKLKAALRGKEKVIEELDVKVGLLNSRLGKAKDQDHVIRDLRKSLQLAAESDKKLREDIENAKKEFEARSNVPRRNVDLTTKDLSVLSLQNQLKQLQSAFHLANSKQAGIDIRWLKEPIVNHKGVVRSRLQLSCKQLFRDLRDTVDKYEQVAVRRTSQPNAHASTRLRHLAQIEGLENIKLQIMHLLT